MTAATVEAAVPTEKPRVASFRVLLSLFAIVPICLALAGWDRLQGGDLRRHLPSHPDQVIFFTLVFNLPHVVASHLVLFFDREYVLHYQRWIGIAAFLTTVPVIATFLVFGERGGQFLVFGVTLWHVIGQQAGMAGGLLRTPHWSFPTWKYLLTAGGVLMSLAHPDLRMLGLKTHFWLALVGASLLLPTTMLAIWLTLRSKSGLARSYLWANQLMVLSIALFLAWGYPIFAALTIRVVHDLTALYVYSVHDQNRNRPERKNLLHRLLRPIPTGAVTVVVAMGVAFLLTKVLPGTLSLLLIGLVSGMHYVLEAVTWRSKTPHRAHLSFGV